MLHEGAILDGRNRYRASRVVGVDAPLTQFDGADPLAFVVSLNLRRRHLDESQRAMVAAKLATMKVGGDRRSDHSANWQNDRAQLSDLLIRAPAGAPKSPPSPAPISVSAAADMLNVAHAASIARGR